MMQFTSPEKWSAKAHDTCSPLLLSTTLDWSSAKACDDAAWCSFEERFKAPCGKADDICGTLSYSADSDDLFIGTLSLLRGVSDLVGPSGIEVRAGTHFTGLLDAFGNGTQEFRGNSLFADFKMPQAALRMNEMQKETAGEVPYVVSVRPAVEGVPRERKASQSKSEERAKRKFKTQMCIHWRTALCPFGDRCHFAHGIHELRSE